MKKSLTLILLIICLNSSLAKITKSSISTESASFLFHQKATIELHDYIFKLDLSLPAKKEISLDEVRKYIDQGADVNARSISGDNSIVMLVESWANERAADKKHQEYLEVMKLLLENGANPSMVGNRGYSAAWYAYGFYRGGSQDNITEVMNLLQAYKFDFNARHPSRNPEVHHGDGLVHLLSKGFTSKSVFSDFAEKGMNIKAVDNYGNSIIHYNAGVNNPEPSEQFITLNYLFDLLSPIDQKKFSNLKSLNGETPLHFAARSGSLKNIKYLVENMKVDLSEISFLNQTPLDLAYLANRQEVVNYLSSMGAKKAKVNSQVSCTKRNTFKLTYEKLVDLIKTCKLKKIEKVLSLLPKKYLAFHTLSYFTHAVQGASTKYPHVTLFGEDGKLMIALNGHKSQTGFYNLEIVHFKDKKFELRDIKFDQRGRVAPKISEANPAKCIGCHGSSPKPLWDQWTFWPGKFGSQIDVLTPREIGYLKEFKRNRNRGRYKHLPKFRSGHFLTSTGIDVGDWRKNVQLDVLIGGLMSEKISNEIITDEKLSRFKYAFLGALSCNDKNVNDFLPESVKKEFSLNLDSIKRDIQLKGQRELDNRFDLLLSTGKFESRYVYQSYLSFKNQPNEYAGRVSYLRYIASIRYLAENRGFDTSGWFTPYNNGLESYVIQPGMMFNILTNLWKSVIEKEDLSSDFYQAYQKRENTANIYAFDLCENIQKASFESLSDTQN